MIPRLLQKVTVWTLIIRKTTSRITALLSYYQIMNLCYIPSKFPHDDHYLPSTFAGRPFTIPLIYSLVLWNNFLKKKKRTRQHVIFVNNQLYLYSFYGIYSLIIKCSQQL